MEIYLVKQENNTFAVAYDDGHEKVSKIGVGAMVKAKITQPRNIGFHKKFFALIKMVYDNQDHYKNREHLRKDLIVSAGFYNEHITIWGEVIKVAKSISFGTMDNLEFQNLYDRVTDEIVQHFNFDKQSIIDNVDRYF